MTQALGLLLATSSGRSPAELGEQARAAELAGFSSVQLTERVGDVLSVCPSVVAATSHVTVGTAIANIYLHPPVLTALTAATLDEVSGGRFVLGLGTANAVLNHDLLGFPRVPPLQMVEEYVGMLRAVLAGRPFAGAVFGLAAPLALDRPPARPGLAIHLAALQPRMLELAGRIADGVILTLMSPDQAAQAVATVRSSAARAGRDPAAVQVTCVLQCCLSDNPTVAKAAARGVVLRFARHPSAARLFAQHDPDGGMDAVRAALARGEAEKAAAAVPQRVADAFVLQGSATDCRGGLALYHGTGIDLPVVFPMPVEGTWDAVVPMAIAALAPDVTDC